MKVMFGINTDFMPPFQGLKIRPMSIKSQGCHPVLKYLALSGIRVNFTATAFLNLVDN
jgi:hypothetical protein